MKQKQIVRMLAFVAIMLLLMPLRSMAVKIPVAILRTNADGKTKTLTFTYAERPKVFARRGQNGVHKILQLEHTVYGVPLIYPTWISINKDGTAKKNQPITNIVFNKSFASFRPVSTCNWFPLDNLISIKGIENLNTSNVKSMACMFENCKLLTSIDLSGFNTSNVEYMLNMFEGCSSLESLDLSGFNTSNVKDMGGMFDGCSSLESLDLSGFNTSNVESLVGMFEGCSSLKNIDLSGFNTSNVIDMTGMFSCCSSLTSIDLSGFNTSNVEMMFDMFKGCSSLESIDLSGFNNSNVKRIDGMFEGCSSLESLDLSGFNTANVNTISSMFKGCSKLSVLNISNLNIPNIFRNSLNFYNKHLSSLPESSRIENANQDCKDIFQGCSSLSTLYIGHNDFDNANELFEKDNLFNGIGTSDRPCRLVVDSNFDKSVLADHIYTTSGEDNKPIYNWLGGYFTLDNSSADARP